MWGKLEEAVFADVDVEDLKVSVFGGPVFAADDRVYRGCGSRASTGRFWPSTRPVP